MKSLFAQDPTVAKLIQDEAIRQEHELNLIASENYTSPAVMQAVGSILTNKYAEGYPGKRYYGGCEIVDQIENLAISRAQTLFGAQHVNVQPHAGSQANMAAYTALLQPGDTIMGMSLASGGHLTHGHKVNFSGVFYKAVQYGVDRHTEELNYEEIQQLALEHKPRLIVAGASAYSRIIDFKRFREIADSVGAYFIADIAHIAGLIAAQLHPSPITIADCTTSTSHKTLRGPRSGFIMCKSEHKDAVDRAIMPGLQGGPLLHVIAGKAVAFKEAQSPEFVVYQKQVIANAQTLAAALQQKGYRIVAGGTDNHLFIVDLRSKNVTGRKAELILQQAGIIISRSCIPFDPEKPWLTSGMRLGTAAVTTRGMKEIHMLEIAELIDYALCNPDDESKLHSIKQKAMHLCIQFPIYPEYAAQFISSSLYYEV